MSSGTTSGQTLNTRIQLRRGTTSQWNANGANVILGRGEIGAEYYDTDNPLAGLEVGFKVGDGVSHWFQLFYHRADTGIQANGRAQRDLSVFGNITQQGNARNFTTLSEAVDAILHPYVPPTISLNGAPGSGSLFEVGHVINQAVLTLNIGGSGSFPLNLKAINRLPGTLIASESNGGIALTNSPLVGTENNVTLSSQGAISYQGRVTNTRQPNDTVLSNAVDYNFQYPVFYGYSTTNAMALSDAATQSFLLGGYAPGSSTNSNGIYSSLQGKSLTIIANPRLQYLIIAFPVALQPLTQLKQYIGGSPVSDQFDNLDRKIVDFTQSASSPTSGAWTNVPYYVYMKRDVTGYGTNVEYRTS